MLGLTIAFGAVCVVLAFVAGCSVGALRERQLVQAVIEQDLARKINSLEHTIDDVIDLNRKTSLHLKAVETLVWTPPSEWPSTPPSEWPEHATDQQAGRADSAMYPQDSEESK